GLMVRRRWGQSRRWMPHRRGLRWRWGRGWWRRGLTSATTSALEGDRVARGVAGSGHLCDRVRQFGAGFPGARGGVIEIADRVPLFGFPVADQTVTVG